MTARKKQIVGRWLLGLALSFGASAGIAPSLHANNQAGQQVVTATELKEQAFQALRAGKFDQTHDYLDRAAAASPNDQTLGRMAGWTRQFEEQRRVFVGERQREYEKAVKEINLLMEKGKDIYAMEIAARAYLLAEDKATFLKEPWAVKLLTNAKKLAGEFERTEQWLKSLRLYSQLSSIEEDVPDWKEHLKTSTRRIRLLALYTPENLKKIQEADVKEREEVDAILKPDAKPTTKPAMDEEAEQQSRIDWRETLRDVRMDMLAHALVNARANYFKDVPYTKMMEGGLTGLRVVLTTPALESAFEGLADRNKRSSLLGTIDALLGQVQNVKPDEEAEKVQLVLTRLKGENDRTVRLPDEVLVSEFADGAFAALDPFSNVIWPSDWEEFQKTTKGEFSGVGIQISNDDAGYLKVVSPLEDSPAYRAGIKPDYLITHIDGKAARWISLNQAVKRITGPPGTPIQLTVKHTDGQTKEYRLVRETIKVASVKGWIHRPGGGWDYFIDHDQKIGYVRMTNFSKTTVEDLDGALDEMKKQGARGMILDLRYNPGGLLNAATGVVDRFLDRGMIVSTRAEREDSPNPPSSMSAGRRYQDSGIPLIVLVNQYSASASEIVSGALKDHKRALIVGERTFGKGSVQMLYPLGSGQAQAVLKLTTSHYYLPNGKCIHREENSKEWGVDPDVTVEMTPDQMRSAIDARQQFDILRDADPAPAQGAQIEQRVGAVEAAVEKDKTVKKKDPLSSDAQLAAALLLMRLQIANGAPLAL